MVKKKLGALSLLVLLGLPVPSFSFPVNNTAVVGINVTGLTAGNCVQAGTSGNLTTTASACSSGTVTSVTGTSPVTSSGGNTPAIGCATCVVSVTAASTNIAIAGTGTSPTVNLGSSPSVTGTISARNAVSGSFTGFGFNVGDGGVSNIPQAYIFTNNLGGNTGIGGNVSNTINTITGACLDIGSYSGTTLTTNILTADCSGNAGLTGNLHLGNLTDAGLTSGNCVQAGASGLLANAAGGSCPTTRSNTTLLGGTHIETVPSTSVAGLATNTFTFGAAYAAAPVCVVSTVASGTAVTPAFNVTSTSTTQLVVTNTNATTQSYSAVCVGF